MISQTKAQCSLIYKVFKLFTKKTTRRPKNKKLKLKVIRWKIQMANKQEKEVLLYQQLEK